MSIVGTVSQLVGRAVAIKADGSERILTLGDQVFADEMVRVSPDSSIEISMEGGEPVRLDAGQSWLVSNETFNEAEDFDLTEAVADIESIQEAILAGVDPTEVAEATAAGETAAGGEGNEGSSTVNVLRTGEEVDPTAGHETVGFDGAPEELIQEEGLGIDSAAVSISGPDTVAEGAVATYSVTLSRESGEDVTVSVITGHITTDNGDIVPVVESVVIPAGETSADFDVVALDDYFADSGEQYTASITEVTGGDFDNLTVGQSSVTTTVIDDANPDTPDTPDEPDQENVTIILAAADESGQPISDGQGGFVTANEAAEGEFVSYVALALDPDGNVIADAEGTVEVIFNDGSATGNEDYDATSQTVTLGVAFSTELLDDYLADNGETFTADLVDGTYSNAEVYENVIVSGSVTSTIIDDSNPDTPDTPDEPDQENVTIILAAADESGQPISDGQGGFVTVNEAAEGEFASYVALAIDPDGNVITDAEGTVDVSFADETATGDEDYDATSQTVTLGVAFSTELLDDYIADHGETFTVNIVDDTYSNADVYENVITAGTVTTTIIDDSNPDTPDTPDEPDQEVVTITLVAADENGQPISDGQGGFVTANEGAEGEFASYVAIALDPEGNVIEDAEGSVDIVFADETATGNEDYDATAQTVTLGVAFSAELLDDYIADNGETFTANIVADSYTNAADYENVELDGTVTTTIIDDSNPDTPDTPDEPDQDNVTIALAAADENGVALTDAQGNLVLANEVPEGTAASYVAVALDPEGNIIADAEGTVGVSFADETATGSEDYVNAGQTVTLGVAFATDTLDDYIADNGETFTANLIDGTYSNAAAYENVIVDGTVTTTIIDDSNPDTPDTPDEPDQENVTLTLVAADENGAPLTDDEGNFVQANEAPEGTAASYIAIALDPEGNIIADAEGTVEVSFADETATGAVDYVNAGQTVTLGVAFTTDALDDYIADNGETFTANLVDGTYSNAAAYENVVVDGTVTTTIIDDSNPDTPDTPDEPDEEVVTIALAAAGENGEPLVDSEGNLVLANAVEESNPASYVAVAIDPDGNIITDAQGTVSVSFTDETAEGAVDYVATPQTVTLGVAFSTDTIDDYIADSGETFTVSIDQDSYSNAADYENVVIDGTVTTTILDEDVPGSEDTIFVSILDPVGEVIEGFSGTFPLELRDENGVLVEAITDVVVDLSYSGTATDGSDYTSVAQVVIPAGSNRVNFDIATLVDDIVEPDEVVDITITGVAGGGFEAIEIDAENDTADLVIIDDTDLPLLSINDITVDEDAGQAVFTVTLSGSTPAGAVTVDYISVGGTATQDVDYDGVSGTLTFPLGTTTQEIVVPITDDMIDEVLENYTIELSNPVNAAIADGIGLGGITDEPTPGDEDTAFVSIVDNVGDVIEGNNGLFPVELRDEDGNLVNAITDVTVDLSYSGTATDGSDYTSVAQVIIPAGSSSVNLDIATLTDAIVEPDEIVDITITGVTGGGFEAIEIDSDNDTADLVIIDDTELPSLSINDVTVNEDDGQAVFTVTLSGNTPAGTVTVDYISVGGTAIQGTDYTGVSGSLTFPLGTTTQEIVVPITDDMIDEGLENYTIELSNAVNAIISDPEGLGGIVDEPIPGDEDTAFVSIVDNVGSVVEGNSGSFPIELRDEDGSLVDAITNVTVNLSYSGTASNGADYNGIAQVTIPAGSSSTLLNIQTLPDSIVENLETVDITITSVSGGGFEAIEVDTAKDTADMNIIDDTELPSLSINDVTVNEDDGVAIFTVTLSGNTPIDTVSVNFASTGGTAIQGTDYTGVSGTLDFPVGTTTQQIEVPITDDMIDEGLENYTILLSSPVNATISDPEGLGGIVDEPIPGDEDTAFVSIVDPVTDVTEGGTGNFPIELRDENGALVDAITPVTVTLSYSGTATNGSDYNGTAQVTIPAGSDGTNLAIQTLIDDEVENLETVDITITNVTGGGFEQILVDSDNDTADMNIIDDTAPPSLSINDITVHEDEGVAVFTVVLTGNTPIDTVTVDYISQGGTATEDVDYDAVGGQLSFPVGTTSQQIEVPITDDLLAEGLENYTIVLSNPVNATISKGTGLGGIYDEPESDVLEIQLFAVEVDGEGNIIPGSETNVNSMAEQNDAGTADITAHYAVLAVDASGNPLASQPGGTVTVNVGSVADGDALADHDSAAARTATVGTAFSIDSIDDALADSGETFTLNLQDGTWSNDSVYEDVAYTGTVTTTIYDASEPELPPEEPDTGVTLKLFAKLEDGTLTDANTIAEQNDAGTADITATYVVLAVDAAGNPLAAGDQPGGTVTVSVGDAGDTASTADYNSAASRTETVGTEFTITSADDALADSGETFSLGLTDGSWSEDATYEDVAYEGDVTTTITDASDPTDPPEEPDTGVTLKLFAKLEDGTLTDANTIAEQNDAGTADITATYVVLAVDAAGNPLAAGDQPGGTVTVNVGDAGDTASTADYNSAASRTETVGTEFTITSADDALADSGETFSLDLADGSWSEDATYEDVAYEGDVTTTITDASDPTDPPEEPDTGVTLKLFAKLEDGTLTDANTIAEQNDAGTADITATYVVLAVDAAGNPLAAGDQPGGTVTVNVGDAGDTASTADYNSAASRTETVGTEFTITSADDALADSGETFSLDLADGSWSEDATYEDVAYEGDVTTTITDASDPTDPPEEPDTGVTLKLFAKLEDGTLTDANTIAEQNDAGTADITATYVVLAVDAAGNPLPAGDQPGGTVTVNVGDAGDTASTADYNSAASRTETVGTEFTITSADDALADSGETFSLDLADGSWSEDATYEDVAYEGDVTTTITDASDPTDPPEEPDTGVTLKLFAKLEDGTLTDANTIAEQNDAGTADITGTYVVLAVDAAGNPLAAGDQPGGTVTVNVGDAGDTASTADYNSAASRTETVGTEFTITSADDALADSGETFSLDLADGSWSEDATYEDVAYEGDVTTTITDASDPTDPPEEPDTGVTLKLFAKLEDGTLTDANTIAEQNDAGTADITATYVVLAVDAAGNPLAAGDQPGGTVTVSVGDAGDTASTADYNSAASRTETVGTEFTITSADDALADSGETFSLDLADGSWSEDATYEDVAYEGDVTTTITDASDPTDPPEEPDVGATVSITGPSTVIEGQPATYSISVDTAPEEDMTVVVVTGFITGEADASDFTPVTEAVVIKAGDTVPRDASGNEITITVNTTHDQLVEPDEDYRVEIQSATNGGFESVAIGDPVVTTILDDDDAPEILNLQNLAVSEEGLFGGLADTTGSDNEISPADTTDDVDATGTLNFTDADNSGTDFTIALSGPVTTIKSDGVDVTWSWDANAGVNGVLTGTAGSVEVATITLGAVSSSNGSHSANYTVELKAPVDHPENSNEDVLALQFGVSVSDGANPADTGSFIVNIEDDMPISGDINDTITVPLTQVNVMLVLDFSGSMAGAELTAMKAAVTEMLQAYDDTGDVLVQIVSFATSASVRDDGGWISASDAIDFIDGLTNSDMNGWTNYDDALAKAETAFAESGKIDGANNVSYFLSDGEPTAWVNDNGSIGDPNNPGENTGTVGIDTGEQAAWETFVTNNDIDSYAVGFAGADVSELEPIAYNGADGVNGTERPALDATAQGSDLTETLLQTIIQPTVGNLFGSLATGGFGADGNGHVTSIDVTVPDGVGTKIITFTYDGTTLTDNSVAGDNVVVSGSSFTVETSNGGMLTVDMADGDYSYTPDATLTGSITDTFTFSLQDNDGDISTGSVNLNVEREIPPTPELVSNSDAVYEADMSTGTNSAGNGETATGNILSDDTVPAGFSLTNVTIAGGSTVDSGNTITVTTAEGNTLVVNKTTGAYTYSLLSAVDHPANTDTVVDSFTYTVANQFGGSSATADLDITIHDDAPIAQQQTVVLTIEPVTTNLAFIIDMSSSMNNADRELAKEAVEALVAEYEALGNVNLNIVEFWGNNNTNTGWVDSSYDYNYQTGTSGTDIEQGLREMVEGSYSGNQPDADQDVLYFFGDGNTYNAYETDFNAYTGITNPANNPWGDFVTGGSIDKLFSYSVNTSSVLSDITHLADNGENLVSADAVNISDISDLEAAVTETAGVFTEGSLLEDISGNAIIEYGADGGRIADVTIGAITVNYDASNPVQDVQGAHGIFTLDFETGGYTYKSTTLGGLDVTEVVNVSITDNDGDTLDTVLLNININFSPEFNKITGTAGDDTLTGTDANESISGLAGNDILTGGDGGDLFVWNESDLGTAASPYADVVTDFNTAEGDVLDLSDVLVDPDYSIGAVENGGHLQLQITNSTSDVVQTVDVQNLSVSNDTDAQALLNNLLANDHIDDGN